MSLSGRFDADPRPRLADVAFNLKKTVEKITGILFKQGGINRVLQSGVMGTSYKAG